MILAFILSMPNNNAWNGEWTGEGVLYAKTERFTSKKWAREILDGQSYYYNFGDGWGASVEVKHVNAKEARTIRKNSQGFCGYEWMINSIKFHQEIRT